MPIPPCKQPYTKPNLEIFVSSRLGIEARTLSMRLHRLKEKMGLRGRPVTICLDDGEVYDPVSGESIGNLYDGA